jgi:hypothetical protein
MPLLRTKKKAFGDEDERESLLGAENGGKALVHNRKRGNVYVFDSHTGGSVDAIEMEDIPKLSKRRRRGRKSPELQQGQQGDTLSDEEAEGEEEEEAYLWHEVLPHHTLAGIALQYRTTVGWVGV